LNQNAVLAALKSFYRFLKSEGFVAHDPASAQEYAREPKSLPRNVLTPEEARRILDHVDPATPLGNRDRAILEVFYATGIRKEELRGLAVGDANLEEALLRITLGKGARDRVVPLGTMAVNALQNYLSLARPKLLETVIPTGSSFPIGGNRWILIPSGSWSKSMPKRPKSRSWSRLMCGVTPAPHIWCKTTPI
jgi:site-specific recombinase XerD